MATSQLGSTPQPSRRWLFVLIVVLHIVIVGLLLIITFSLLRPHPLTGPLSCPAPYATTGDQKLDVANVVVPHGCVLVIDSSEGLLNTASWNHGGVVALGPGTYSGFMSNGGYDVVPQAIAQQHFCDRVKQIANRPGHLDLPCRAYSTRTHLSGSK